MLAAITHNLLRAAGTLAGRAHAVARGAHPAPASGAGPRANKPCTYPLTCPGSDNWKALWDSIFIDRSRQVMD